MAKIDPMYNLVNTIIDDKETIIFLGAGASMEGSQEGKRFPGFDELIDCILKDWGFDPSHKANRFKNFEAVIKRWENEKKLSARLSKYLDGEPGPPHYYLAALSIALFGNSNALLYLTANYDDLMKKAFTDLERNQIRKFNTIVLPLPPHIIGSDFQGISVNAGEHLKNGHPVILKLFGDLNSQSPIFKQEEMFFEPTVEHKLIDWMKKPMIFIGYSFSDKIIEQLLISARGNSPIFLVNPIKKLPALIKNLDRVNHIQKTFSEFILDLFTILKEKHPAIIEKAENILSALPISKPPLPERTINAMNLPPVSILSQGTESKKRIEKKSVKTILVLSANPRETSQLRFDEEIREIEEGLQRARLRDRYDIKHKLALRFKDLRRALLDYKPQIVHFSGHGSKEGLTIEDDQGKPTLISAEVLSGLFKLCAEHVECVMLMACYSAIQATAISEHIDYVIGMWDKIPDKAAIEFSIGFYDALGAGRSVDDAFEFGRTAVMQAFPNFPIHYIPALKKKTDFKSLVFDDQKPF